MRVVSLGKRLLPTSKNGNLTTGQQAKLSELLKEFGSLFSDKQVEPQGANTQ